MYRIEYYINPQDLIDLRNENAWKIININQDKRALEKSIINISVYDDNACIGVGRIVGDGAFKGLLTDIMTKKEYRGKGIGKLIVTTLISKLYNNLEIGDVFCLEASPTTGNRDFYIKCGMKYKPEVQDGVYLWLEKR